MATNITTKFLRQDAIYWPPDDVVDPYGELSFGPPVDVKVRWDDAKEEFFDENNEKRVSNAVIIVDQEIEIDGLLMLGTTEDIDSGFSDDPRDEGASQIRGTETTPTIDAKDFLYVAMI